MAKPYLLMMTLRSPFARRIRIALERLKIPYDPVPVEPFHPTPEFYQANPMGMVPVLVRDDGKCMPDSGLILEYLNDRYGNIWPKDPELRFDSLQASTYAVGLMEVSVRWYLEQMRPENERSRDSMEDCEQTAIRILQTLREIPWYRLALQSRYDLGTALDYLDFRHPTLGWKTRAPELLPTYEKLLTEPVFEDTKPRMT